MKNIAIIYMGGTFGCIGQPLAPMPASDFLKQLTALMPQASVLFTCFAAPSIKDSTELNATDWLKLSLDLQQLSTQCEHFIIIHGTDTLSYAAAVLHHIFKQQHHIILTGSQQPLLNTQGTALKEHSDAWQNLQFAMQHIQQTPKGVYLAFDQQIHSANQNYKQHTENFNAFLSPTEPVPTAYLKENFHLSEDWLVASQNIRIHNYYLTPTSAHHLNLDLQALLSHPPHVLILQGFGSGNLPYSLDLENTLKQLIAQGCWVIISSQVLYGAITQKYATGSWLNNVNLVFDPHYSQADLYARSLLLYLQYGDQKDWQQYWV